jgi:hypothetical protein
MSAPSRAAGHTASIEDINRGVADWMLVTPSADRGDRATWSAGAHRRIRAAVLRPALLSGALRRRARHRGDARRPIPLGTAIGALSHAIALLTRTQETLIAVS